MGKPEREKQAVLSLRVPEATNRKLKLIAMARDKTARDVLIDLVDQAYEGCKAEINELVSKLDNQ